MARKTVRKVIRKPHKKKHHLHKIRERLHGSASFLFVMGIALVAIFAVLMTSAETKWLTAYKNNPAPGAEGELASVNPGGTCCETGDGENCRLVDGQDITYNGQTYALLRSNILSGEKGSHIRTSGQFASNGQEIFLNQRSDTNKDSNAGPTCTRDKDWYYRGNIDEGTHFCWGVPDDQIILLCSKANPPGKCSQDRANALWDAYFRRADDPNPGIPKFIKYCYLPLEEAKVLAATDEGRPNLQLQTFTLAPTQEVTRAPAQAQVASYLTPYCKPAIYLYPEQNMPVHVKIFPQGKLTVTIPHYPNTGWNAFAFTDGSVLVDNKQYDYLYYEAEIPDRSITKPEEGYVIEKQALPAFLPTLLSKLGLNTKERTHFTEYWTDVLPDSPYYKVSIIPQKTLDMITPLFVFPRPQTVVRVTLYFEGVETYEAIPAPTITPVSRSGFTVVEWGGMYKKSGNSTFTCLQ